MVHLRSSSSLSKSYDKDQYAVGVCGISNYMSPTTENFTRDPFECTCLMCHEINGTEGQFKMMQLLKGGVTHE